MKAKTYLMAAAACLLAACSSDEQEPGGGQPVPILLTASVDEGGETRAGTNVQNTKLDASSTFYVYFPTDVRVGDTSVGSSTVFTVGADQTSTTPATQPFFNPEATSAAVHAYYPYVTGGKQVTNTTESFSVEQDQSTDDGYKKSDLMYATIASLSKSSATVTGSLTFQHKMAKLVVNATVGTGVSTIKDIRIIGGSRTINIATPQSCTLGTSLSTANSTSSYITMYTGGTTGSATCAALIPPQNINGNFLQIVTDKGNVTCQLDNKAFASGNAYTLNVTVNAASIGTTVTVTGWAANGTATVNPTVERTNAPSGAEAVDLGLSVKWANMNVGATTVTDYGTYFAWGETSGYTSDTDYAKYYFAWTTYAWCQNSSTTLTKYCPTAKQSSNWFDTSATNVAADNKLTLDLGDDAARANWGGAWRMPTKAEWEELLNTTNCDRQWTTQNGVNGYKFTGKKAGYTSNSIFLPAAGYRGNASVDYQGSLGYYWSSSLYEGSPGDAWYLYFNSSGALVNYYDRYYGRSVRAVQ